VRGTYPRELTRMRRIERPVALLIRHGGRLPGHGVRPVRANSRAYTCAACDALMSADLRGDVDPLRTRDDGAHVVSEDVEVVSPIGGRIGLIAVEGVGRV